MCITRNDELASWALVTKMRHDNLRSSFFPSAGLIHCPLVHQGGALVRPILRSALGPEALSGVAAPIGAAALDTPRFPFIRLVLLA